jgi:hypothetical protein
VSFLIELSERNRSTNVIDSIAYLLRSVIWRGTRTKNDVPKDFSRSERTRDLIDFMYDAPELPPCNMNMDA